LNPVWILEGNHNKHVMTSVSILFFHRTWPLLLRILEVLGSAFSP